MPPTIIELLNKGIDANNSDPFRKGNVVHLPFKGDVVLAGDIHGHRRNFERIVAYADLPKNPDRHLVLQEIIHGGPSDLEGGCLSYKLLFDVVQYKLEFPDRVHILLGNHDTAFINNSEVMKDGKEMNRSMRQAMDKEFGQSGEDIKMAMRQYFFSQPLAVRCENRILLSHSLPSDRYIDKFDHEIFNRQLKVNDVVRPGSAYILTWGRKHSQAVLDTLAKVFDVDIFVLGHQTQKEGWKQIGENTLVIISEHNHGCILPIDLTKSHTIDQLINSIVQLASLA